METLNILLATTEYPPYPLVGTGMFAYNLSKEIKKHNLTIITLWVKGSEIKEEKDNITIKRIKTNLGPFNSIISQPKKNRSMIDRRILFGRALRKFLKKEVNLKEYDVLHNIDVMSASFLNHKEIRKKLPSVTSVNDYYALSSSWNPFKFPYKSTDFILRYFHYNTTKHFNIRAIRDSSRIIANSNFVSNIVVNESGIGMEKVDVVHRGIDFEKFNLKPGKDKYTNHNILFVGGNMERKGAKYIVYSAVDTLKEFPDTTYTIIGDAPKRYLSEINRFIKKHNIEKNFKFIAQAQKEEVPGYHNKANVFVMPSLIEGLGQVFMEAMAAQTPVIGTRVGGIPEIIKEGTGFLVKPESPRDIAEAVNSILKNPKAAEAMGKRGREVVKKEFTKEIMTKKIIESYKRAITSR